MIRYYCKNCNIELKNNTEDCIICKEKALEENKIYVRNIKTTSKVYWCSNCNIPLYDEQCSICGSKGHYLITDLRPVFPEERLLLEILIGQPLRFIKSSVWNGAGNRYFIDGQKLKVSISSLILKDIDTVIEELAKYKDSNSYDFFNKNMETFIEANKRRYNSITSEAMEFTKRVAEGFEDNEMFVSFSGGKDSTVVSDLVVKALSRPEILHIFGDTTLEFPTTMEYVSRFRKNNRKTPILSARNKEKRFDEMCELVGPPSRVMRWCCTVFKTGAINKRINGVFKDNKKLLTFYGIRRSESASRSKYDRESNSPKITKQKVVSPIIDWFDFDIWLYILATGIDFNDAYRLGFARVGCWCCPNNSEWSQFLSSVYMPEQFTKWRDFLISFAKRIGKPDPEVYVDTGKWKARQGGNGVEYSEKTFVPFKPCVTEGNAFNYELKKPITEQLYEFFKPFGWISKDLGNEKIGEVYIVDRRNNPIIRIVGKIGGNLLKVTILKLPLSSARGMREARMKIDCQLTKYQMCVNCLGCESVCKYNAISIKKDVTYSVDNESSNNYDNITRNIYYINDDKCLRCGECISHFDGGCYIRKVLATKRGE